MNSPLYPRRTGVASCAGATDRAGVEPTRPVFRRPTGAGVGGHFQSDGDFATLERWVARAQVANRRSDRLLTRVQIGLAAIGVAWAVLPALLMALVGGTPA